MAGERRDEDATGDESWMKWREAGGDHDTETLAPKDEGDLAGGDFSSL